MRFTLPRLAASTHNLNFENQNQKVFHPMCQVGSVGDVRRGRMDSEDRGRLKLYILIREGLPPGFAVLAAAHASLAAYLRFRDTPEVVEWVAGTFHKVVCQVTDAEFERAKDFEDHVLLTESALGGREVALAFKPRLEWPKAFRFYRLYRS